MNGTRCQYANRTGETRGTSSGAGLCLFRCSGGSYAVVLLTCGVVYWLFLGAAPLDFTEGHRAIPGWELTWSSRWAPTLFEQVYLRKPPGMAWAVAVSSAVLGVTEFAARAVSATAATVLALAATWFGRRWFGPGAGLICGLATALLPLSWRWGRVAEAEMLNASASAIAALALLHLGLWPDLRTSKPGRGESAARAWAVLLAGGGIAVATAVKGPAGAPVIVASLAAGCVVGRRLSPLRRRSVIAGLSLGGLGAAAVAWGVARTLAANDLNPVIQSPVEFLWPTRLPTLRECVAVASMPVVALASALPASLALPVAFRRIPPTRTDTRPWPGQPAASEEGMSLASDLARAIAWTCTLSLGILAALGVRNARYALPGLVLLPMLAGYATRPLMENVSARRYESLGLLLAATALLIAGLGYGTAMARPRPESDPRLLARALSSNVPAGACLWADHAVEARPDVLHYLRQECLNAGRAVQVRWVVGLAQRGDEIPPGTLCLLRDDADSGELTAMAHQAPSRRVAIIAEGTLRGYRFALCRVEALPP